MNFTMHMTVTDYSYGRSNNNKTLQSFGDAAGDINSNYNHFLDKLGTKSKDHKD